MKQRMYRILAVASVAMLLFGMTGCGNSGKEKGTEKNGLETDKPADVEKEENIVKAPVSLKAEYQYDKENFETESDGHTVKGYIYVPKNLDGKKAVLIVSHGFAVTHEEAQSLIDLMVPHGVIVIACDFYGGSQRSMSGGSMADMSVRTEQADLESIMETACKRDDVDTDRLYLFGVSQGGFVSTLAACANPDKVAGMYLYAPAYYIGESMTAAFKSYDDIKASGSEDSFWYIGVRYQQDVYGYDIYETMPDYDGPVHIFHGTDDEMVDMKYSERAVKTFPNAQLTTVKGEGHSVTETAAKELEKVIAADLSSQEE